MAVSDLKCKITEDVEKIVKHMKRGRFVSSIEIKRILQNIHRLNYLSGESQNWLHVQGIVEEQLPCEDPCYDFGTEEPIINGLELTFDDIANVPVADALSVSNWNAFFDLPQLGNPFTSVEVESVERIKYGLLYNWYAATDARNITSAGDFVVPLASDFHTLLEYYGATEVNDPNLGHSWNIVNSDVLQFMDIGSFWSSSDGTNTTNLSFRGAGVRSVPGQVGEFFGSGVVASFIAKDLLPSGYTKFMTLLVIGGNKYLVAIVADTEFHNNVTPDFCGQSIRLVRPATTPELSLADGTSCAPYIGNDGKTYPTVKIGTKVWLAVNLAETKFRDGSWIHGFDGGVYTPISNEDWAALTTGALCAYDDDLNNVYESVCLVKLIGGSGITIKDYLFSSNNNLLNVVDSGCIQAIGVQSFRRCYGLTNPSFNYTLTIDVGGFTDCINLVNPSFTSLLSAGDYCFDNCTSLASTLLSFPSLITVGNNCFSYCNGIIELYMPVLENLGTSTLNNDVFDAISGQTIILTIPAALMTCNGGNPDGDIQVLQTNNTLTIVTI